MADLEQKLKFGADTSGLDKVRRAATAAFSPRPLKEMRRESQGLQGDLGRLNAELSRNLEKLRQLDRGSKAWKDMRKDVRQVREEAQLVRSALADINSEMAKTGQRRQSFVAGLAQGTGLAQYVPTGPGMGRRMAGAAVGGMIRRGVGAAAAPFMSPGIGGLSNMLSAIPGGGVAAGALQSAAGMYQESVAFQRARLQNMPYLDLSGMDAAGRRLASARAVQAAAQADVNELGAAYTGRLSERQKVARAKASQHLPPQAHPSRGIADFPQGGDFPDPLRQRENATAAAVKAAREGGSMDLIRAIAKRERDADPGTLRTIESTRARAGEIAARKAAADDAASRATRLYGSFLPGPGLGTDLGFAPMETQQMLGGFMGARGGVLGGAGSMASRQFGESMVLRRRFGIDAGLAGGFARGGVAGGGGTGAMTLTQSIATGMAQGLQGSQLVEYAQTQVEMMKRAEQQGVKFDVRSFTEQAMGLSGMGVKGLQAQRIAGGLNQRAMGVGQTGVTDPVSLMMMYAAGFDPSKGFESYAGANLALQGGMKGGVMKNFITRAVGAAQGTSFGPKGKAMLLSRFMKQAGAPIGGDIAQTLLGGVEGGQISEDAKAAIASIQGRAKGITLDDISAQTRRRAGTVGGAAVTEAGLSAQRIGAGAGFAGLMAESQKATIASVKAMEHFAGSLTKLQGTVKQFFQYLDGAIKGAGWLKDLRITGD